MAEIICLGFLLMMHSREKERKNSQAGYGLCGELHLGENEENKREISKGGNTI